eukprot:Gregarina_sp_Poly_1__1576@NODE_139_length_13109_cov_53_487809_g124_i0_p5_GENE_NODE_139_length_13109_cov_53_487809_g124_i0NODE_139_length_13109_cov_53_487809_g124_i0_p5_ORF_typecomplete_len320_score56_85SAP/PF02037_27/2_3e03SAP/PF02037_27/7_8e05SAP/PF02037_27/6_6e03OSTHTH/PF12872_7/0_00033SbsC_C/PF18058_1/0_052_NODE_139_length_13109_cov_53_487809_g124_i068987857
MTTEDAHVKRSQLINEHLQECRAIEKDLKKKKLPTKQKEMLEARLETLREAHEKRLAEFDAAQGTGRTLRPVVPDEPPSGNRSTGEEVIFEDRSWSSLSKRELEDECQRRALSRKGGKEDLVSRLTVFSLDQKSKAARTAGPVTKPSEPRTIKYETVVSQGPSTKQDYRNKNKKLWKRRGPPKAQRKTSSSSGSSDEGSGAEDSGAAEEIDEERVKQLKREMLVQNALAVILKKYSKGIKLDDIPMYLEKAKVVNFTPTALGYSSLEEWISNQPKDILHIEKKSLLIYPPRIGEMPSSSEEESDGDESSSAASSSNGSQ